MRTIASDRLLLRPWRDEDANFLLDLESRWEVVRFLGAQPTIMNNREDALGIQRSLRRTGQCSGYMVRPPRLPGFAWIVGSQGCRVSGANRRDGRTELASRCVLDAEEVAVDLCHQHNHVVLAQR